MDDILRNNIFENISKIVKLQDKVVLNFEESEVASAEELVSLFRDAYGIIAHNEVKNDELKDALKVKSQDGLQICLKDLLCFDLMFCENPYDEKLRQRFFAFFSSHDVLQIKRQGEKVYSRYLEAHPEYHIDTMLQISYCNPDLLKKYHPDNIETIKNGICLVIPSLDNAKENQQSNDYHYIEIRDKKAKDIFTNCYKSLTDKKKFKTVVNFYRNNEKCKTPAEEIITSIESVIDQEMSKAGLNTFGSITNENLTLTDENFIQNYLCGYFDSDHPETLKNILRVCLVNKLAVPSLNYLYFIPIPFLNGRRIGHTALSSVQILSKKIIDEYSLLSSTMMTPLVHANVALSLMKVSKENALKSAKAAIMSRNMSHNLGSHVMSYLKQNLSSVQEMIDDKVLANLIESAQDIPSRFKKDMTENLNVEKNVALPFLRGLGQFISYLQERQDFIATISTDFIPYYTNVNFKDSIYDELNPDKRYLRHPQKMSSKAIDNILLGNIARSEGLGRLTSPTKEKKQNSQFGLKDIVLKYGSFDGDPVKKRTSQARDLEIMRGIDIALPGGATGRQAVFSIIENIIRNAAKHGKWREFKKLELTINIYTNKDYMNASDDDAFSDECKSLKNVFEDLYCKSIDSDDLYFVTVTDNLNTNETTLKQLREAIAEDYLDDKGQLMNQNKGIKEMRISASWLRSIKSDYAPSINNLDKNALLKDKEWRLSNGSNAPVLYTRISSQDGFNHLQYIFCLLKPRKIAVVTPLYKEKEPFISKYCGLFSTIESFLDLRNSSYEFILFDDRFSSHRNAYKGVKKEEITSHINNLYKTLKRHTSSRLFRVSRLFNVSTDLNQTIDGWIQNKEITEKEVESAELILYKLLSGYDKAHHDCIWIQDPKVRVLDSNGAPTNKLVIDGKIALSTLNSFRDFKSLATGKRVYIYRSHHEAIDQFHNFIKMFPGFKNDNPSCSYVEGISGNNSTDRLVRQSSIGELWFYRHLHSMKENIAIIDERLFSKIFGLDESNLYSQNCNDMIESILAKDYLPTVYHQKGVYVFTIVQSKLEADKFILYGVKIDTARKMCSADLRKNKVYRSTCAQLLKFEWVKDENGTEHLDIKPNKAWKKIPLFSRCTIHQGILDKMYGLFGDDVSDTKKEMLTRDLYEFLLGGKNTIEFEEEGTKKYFLPGMCIHSGRSKPSKIDMPQYIPFVQYAAIEQAVLDCKYSLVELLDFARYQK